jgi:hypothetical protein
MNDEHFNYQPSKYRPSSENAMLGSLLTNPKGEVLFAEYPGLLQALTVRMEKAKYMHVDPYILPDVQVTPYSKGDQSYVYLMEFHASGKQYIIKERVPSSLISQSYMHEMFQTQTMEQELTKELGLLGVRLQHFLFATKSLCCVEFVEGEASTWGNFDVKRAFTLQNIVVDYLRNKRINGSNIWWHIYPHILDSMKRLKYTEFILNDNDNSVTWIDPFVFTDNPGSLNFFADKLTAGDFREYLPVLDLPADVTPSVREMVRILQDKDRGPKLVCLALYDIPEFDQKSGGNNSGIYRALFVDEEGKEIMGVAKCIHNTNRFATVRAISQLQIGMRYYGYTDVRLIGNKPKHLLESAKYAMLLSEEAGVGYWDPEFKDYFTRQSLSELEEKYKLLIASGVELNDTHYLVSEQSNVSFIDFDNLRYVLPAKWTRSEYATTRDFIIHEEELLMQVLSPSWGPAVNDFKQRLLSYIKKTYTYASYRE